MPFHDFDILAIISELENETHFSEALFFGELCRYAESEGKALEHLRNSLPALLDGLPNVEYHARRTPAEVELREVEVAVEPAKPTILWNRPVPLLFHALCWSQGGHYHAFVPALSVEVVADSPQELEELLPLNLEAELRRRRAADSLSGLLAYQRVERVRLSRSTVELNVVSPKKRIEALLQEPREDSILSQVATQLDGTVLPRAFEMDEQLCRLAELLAGRHGRSVLMVGPSGGGKTALLYELVRNKRHHHLGSTIFWETTGARLMLGADSFGDWQQRCRRVVAEASASKAVLVLGNLFELAEVGRHATCPQGMAGFFRPYFDRGDLRAVLECTPEQRDALEREHPHLLRSFSVLDMERPSPEKVASILLSVAGSERVSLEAIETVERLHRRYATYSANPGRPLRFLRELMAEHKGLITPVEVAEAFAQESGLPRSLVDDAQALDLAQTREFFSSRLLGQKEAVDLVVDLLASVKAALSPPGRPIASLLFIGPTGVGKTEMARTLAQYLFRDRQRMVRFDMSEFADPCSVERLVGGQGGGQGLLTAKVREQPFGVILFDELEKAGAGFFDLLLQILGEGRLTDAAGRVADFTNSLVVMTSNLGAAAFSKGELGFRRGSSSQAETARRQFMSAVKAAFRPELFNRLDRLVPFAPLDPETAVRVAQRELDRLQGREGIKHGSLDLEVAEGVAAHLAGLGYDKRYGARPLKRAIEKSLLLPLATALSSAGKKALLGRVSMAGGELQVATTQNVDSQPEQRGRLREVALLAMEARRRSQKLSTCRAAQELRNETVRALRLKARLDSGRHHSEEEQQRVARLPARQALLKRLEALEADCRALETEAVFTFAGEGQQKCSPFGSVVHRVQRRLRPRGYPADEESRAWCIRHTEGSDDEVSRDGSVLRGLQNQKANTLVPEALAQRTERLKAQLQELMVDLYTIGFDEPDKASLVLLAEKGLDARGLLSAYLDFLTSRKVEVVSYRLSAEKTRPEENEEGLLWWPPLDAEEVGEPPYLCATACQASKCWSEGSLGVALELQGRNILPLMLGEAGLHAFGSSHARNCEITVLAGPLSSFVPAPDIHRNRTLTGVKRRLYNHLLETVHDLSLDKKFPWNGKSLTGIIAQAIPARLHRLAEEICQ